MMLKNIHGHAIFRFEGLGLSGAEEIRQLESTGCFIGDHARQMLLSKKDDGYDAVHKLRVGWKYDVVLLPTCGSSTIEKVLGAGEKFGYYKSLAGIASHICRMLPELAEEMGFYDVTISNHPISAADCNLYMLNLKKDGNRLFFSSRWSHPLSLCSNRNSAIVFLF